MDENQYPVFDGTRTIIGQRIIAKRGWNNQDIEIEVSQVGGACEEYILPEDRVRGENGKYRLYTDDVRLARVYGFAIRKDGTVGHRPIDTVVRLSDLYPEDRGAVMMHETREIRKAEAMLAVARKRQAEIKAAGIEWEAEHGIEHVKEGR